MRILVTGGAGFIGSHTADRLLDEGHEVIILDSLQPPVHRDEVAQYLPKHSEFIKADVRDKEAVRKALKRVDAVYHFAAYQDYLTDFSTFFDVNATSTALLYEIILEENLEIERVVVASSQAVMGEGLYYCEKHGKQVPDSRSEEQLRKGQWNIVCSECGEKLKMIETPESVSNPQNPYGMSKYAQEKIAVNLGKRYRIPTVALRYSIVQGPRQSVFNAYSGACRIFCLSCMDGLTPILYEDGMSVRDFVNIEDVVDVNILVLTESAAINKVYNVGSGKAYTVKEFARLVMAHYELDGEEKITGEYRFGDTRHILSDISALRSLGWEPKRNCEYSISSYAKWLETQDGLDGILEDAYKKMRQLGVVRKQES